MLKSKRTGLVLIILGVLANNYVYLHDLVRGEEAIGLGSTGWILIVLALVVIAIGIAIVWRSSGSETSQ